MGLTLVNNHVYKEINNFDRFALNVLVTTSEFILRYFWLTERVRKVLEDISTTAKNDLRTGKTITAITPSDYYYRKVEEYHKKHNRPVFENERSFYKTLISSFINDPTGNYINFDVVYIITKKNDNSLRFYRKDKNTGCICTHILKNKKTLTPNAKKSIKAALTNEKYSQVKIKQIINKITQQPLNQSYENCNYLFVEKSDRDRISIYHKEFLLGEGFEGKVYRWRKLHAQGLKAIKEFNNNKSITVQDFEDSLRKECDLLHIAHRQKKIPGIIQHVKLIISNLGKKYLSMTYYEYDLEKELRLKKPRNKSHIQNQFRRLMHALHLLHSKKITHEDIKPTNIGVDKSGNLHLLDFGFAKSPDFPRDPLGGTAIFIHPSNWSTLSFGDYKKDLYALGLTLYLYIQRLSIEDFNKILNHIEDNISENDLIGKIHGKIALNKLAIRLFLEYIQAEVIDTLDLDPEYKNCLKAILNPQRINISTEDAFNMLFERSKIN